MKYSDHFKGILLALVAVLILSPDALLVRLIQTDVWTLLFWRCLLTAIMTSFFLLFRYRSQFFHSFYAIGRTGLVSALIIVVGSLLFIGSLKQTTAANTLVILAAAPIFSSLLSWVIVREKIPLRTKLAIFTCFGGILLIFSGSLQSGLLLGDLMALGATAMWGSNVAVIRSGKAVNMIPANVLGNLSVAPIVYLLGAQPMLVSSVDAGYLLILGLVVLPVSFALITLSPRYLQAPEVSLILLIETVLGPIWVWLALGEVPHIRTVVAGGVILGTLLIHTLLSLRFPQAPSAQG
ncbi:DMT family transporter [uncultured Desulfuromusa sp.]|uniref:DMT family transporter n=1 Tax=uncultured Desulfuromusa sp. TaxID=219183 RepID=UPI002AA8B69B|nr:DMT family transporter [uncultured Desulfuromusa sp.]